MIRISEIRKCSGRRLLVEGTIAGDWVEVLEKSWLEAQASHNGEPMRIDLSGVTWIDDKGRELLKRILQDGAELRATGIMTRSVIEEIIEENGGGDATPPSPKPTTSGRSPNSCSSVMTSRLKIVAKSSA